jgi:hypothetical protein
VGFEGESSSAHLDDNIRWESNEGEASDSFLMW